MVTWGELGDLVNENNENNTNPGRYLMGFLFIVIIIFVLKIKNLFFQYCLILLLFCFYRDSSFIIYATLLFLLGNYKRFMGNGWITGMAAFSFFTSILYLFLVHTFVFKESYITDVVWNILTICTIFYLIYKLQVKKYKGVVYEKTYDAKKTDNNSLINNEEEDFYSEVLSETYERPISMNDKPYAIYENTEAINNRLVNNTIPVPPPLPQPNNPLNFNLSQNLFELKQKEIVKGKNFNDPPVLFKEIAGGKKSENTLTDLIDVSYRK